MKKYQIQSTPFVVPTTDGKLIEEHHGRVATQNEAISIAHMIALANTHWTSGATVWSIRFPGRGRM